MSYRILSLDGGGIWALIEVKALMALPGYDENTSGHTVLNDFDLVAANSGGSIVLGALIENLTLREILGLFESESQRNAIFSLGSLTDVVLHNLAQNLAQIVPPDSTFNLSGIVPKYSANNKLSALRRVLTTMGDVSLAEATQGVRGHRSKGVHLVITGFDYDLSRAVFFRSSEVSGPQWGKGRTSNVTLVEAIHASTNAPVKYFDAPAQFSDHPGHRYWDGAIAGCNNPVLAGVTEAIGLDQDPTSLAVLSIGTGSVALRWPESARESSPFVQPILEPGIVHDLRKVATSIIDDPPDIATFMAHVMTGCGRGVKRPADSRVVRMNPLIRPVKKKDGTWAAPGSMTAVEFAYLANLDLDAIEQRQVDAILNYSDLWVKNVAPNQPIRMDGKNFEPELGQRTFRDAAHAWKAIKT